ncbi:MAG: DegT/DnrJ/EryC1/StrS family aminotransferase, partial [SAR202 cluster bacterium]|nr:DegT/DnrJ/EryC1/StrS family aminotransferase [SAR202 cluster bacterium]
MTSEYTPPTDLYSKIGVKTVIHLTGTSTRYGGTILRPEAKAAMDEASKGLVELGELNEKAGQVLADKVGAEAGMITSGAAGALLLQAAAVIAGTDPASIARLPDTDGMKNEIIMQRVHRMGYDQCYRAAGARIIDIGQGSTTEPWELEAAINDNTAAVSFIVSPGNAGRGLKLDSVLDVAHGHDLPVLVDAMDRETGRVKAEVRDALRDLTGMSWGYDSDTWRKWLGETGGDTVTMGLDWGYLAGTALFLAILIVLVAAQIR